jgi:HEAT repeat protein
MKPAIFLYVLVGLAMLLPAQQSILMSYQQNFIRADLAGKINRLQDASKDERAPEFIGQLYEFALQFTLQYADILKDDPDMIALASFAVQGAGATRYPGAVDTLLKIFSVYQNPRTMVETLKALALAGKGERVAVERLNQYLADQTSTHSAGGTVDTSVLSACISALAVLGDSSSYPVLFTAMIAHYPDTIKQEAETALSSIPGNLKQFLIDIVQRNPPDEKLEAFNVGLRTSRFNAAEHGELAETALAVSFVPGNESDTLIITLRYLAVNQITAMQWTKASPLVIRHYNQTFAGYENGTVTKERLIEATRALGAVKTIDASQALVLKLGLLNGRTENREDVDSAIVLSVIEALGAIGDKQSFDQLWYVSHLSYPEVIQAAAREALELLKW